MHEMISLFVPIPKKELMEGVGLIVSLIFVPKIDKEWMSKDILSPEYDVGVELFLQFALKNVKHPNAIPCPIKKKKCVFKALWD